MSSGLALAAANRGSSGSACCTLIFVGLFLYIYRSGGADWLRCLGAVLFPGVFGWFIWRDRELGTGSRWVALIFASLHAFSLLSGVVIFILVKGGALDRMLLPNLPFTSDAPGKPVDLTNVPEDKSLGLHPASSIITDPPGAKVFVNGQERGKTPLETPLAAGERNEVKVELADFFPATQFRSPNAREHLDVSFTLKAAARLKVSSEPPGARVLAGTKEVLARTPGNTAPLDLGETEILVLLDGYQAHRQTVRLPTGDTALEVSLTPGVKLAVTSTPDQADIFVDGAWLGLTPADVFVAPKGKHAVEVKKDTWAPAKKVFASVTRPVSFAPKLVDTGRVRAQQAVTREQARYDEVNQALEKLQWKIEHMEYPPDSLERQRAALERDMEKAAGALERAEAALKAVEEMRGLPSPAEPE